MVSGMGQFLRNMPEAIKILYILRLLGDTIEVKELHKLVDRLAKIGVCCKEYRFAHYPWGPYSRDLEVDLDILRSSGLISIINGSYVRRIALSERGLGVAGNLERFLDSDFRSKVETVVRNMKRIK
jgi:uncharacterized protein YwgA